MYFFAHDCKYVMCHSIVSNWKSSTYSMFYLMGWPSEFCSESQLTNINFPWQKQITTNFRILIASLIEIVTNVICCQKIWDNLRLIDLYKISNFRSAGHRGGASASSRGRGMTESPCSDMSTRSQSVTEKDAACNTIAISGAGAMGVSGSMAGAAHGYNNEAYNSARQHNPCAPKPLKQLVVTTG